MTLTKIYQQNRRSPYQSFFGQTCTGSRKLYNAANYLVRNLRSAMYKASKGRNLSQKEEDVLAEYRKNHSRLVRAEQARYKKAMRSCSQMSGLKNRGKLKKALSKKPFEPISYGNMSMLYVYEFLDAYFKDTKDPLYYGLPSQSNQQVLRKLAKDWKSYFESLAAYRKDPLKFTGCPRPPRYKRDKATATFTNQIAKLSFVKSRAYLVFPDAGTPLCLGSAADYRDLKYVRTEVVPFYGAYRVCVTFEDKTKAVKAPRHPAKVLGVDHGIDNFMACFSNCDMPSLLYKGLWLKSKNQWFNKRKAFLVGELTQGAPTVKKAGSHALDALSRDRDNAFRDYFYKTAHHLCRQCVKYGIEVIVVGSNSLWKQGSDMGKVQNQNFVSIPFYRFGSILNCVAAGYGIAVVRREESYTSQASLPDKDDIPTYGGNDTIKFSGKRDKKAYTLKDKTIVNSDINGAGNIARKEYPELFKDVPREELIARMINIVTVRYGDIYPVSRVEKRNYRKVVSFGRKKRHRSKRKTKGFYRTLFAA